MQLHVAYKQRSQIRRDTAGMAVSLSPNLRRDRVAFAGSLKQPLRFREAISALHDVVICDLKYQPKDHTAYQAYLALQRQREGQIHSQAYRQTREQLESLEPEPMPAGLEQRFNRLRKVYWNARDKYADYLRKHDPELWRYLTPCDPVITVAPDVLFFECFSKDESSYGCLTVDREAFATQQDVALGTTNVDYSWNLYEQFQKLRTYRETRFAVDPAGFEVATEDEPTYWEEKIDLPQSWLRGFMQLQSAMSLPMRCVPVSREGLYNVLAFIKRHRAKRSPRAVRFELEPGKPVSLVLEPWEQRITLHSTPYPGTTAATIRTWGRDRLRVLARVLPLVEEVEVFLLGTGLPSFWSVRMGEMRLLLGLSGWTANDWTGAAGLDAIAPPVEPSDALLGKIGAAFRDSPALRFEQVRERTGAAPAQVAAGLNRLALLGQLIHDLPARLYRWRQILPVELSLAQVKLDSPETEAARAILEHKRVNITRNEKLPSGLRALAGTVENKKVEGVLDGDDSFIGGKCDCSHHFRFKLRAGPCRHLQALRTAASGATARPSTLERWLEWITK
jgi:hypothetical protein